MSKYRRALPQMAGKLCVTDGGLETVLVFQKGIEIAEFAAVDLMRRPEGPSILDDYAQPYLDIALRNRLGLVFESATWRASRDWAPKIGFADEAELADANREAVELVASMRAGHETPDTPIVISGCIGPRGDGYDPGKIMSVGEAQDYHAFQVGIFAASPCDLVSAITMTNANEALGIVNAAKAARMPVVISFTVETDGRLPTGQDLGDAIAEVDAATDAYAAYYMINCAHPTHFAETISSGGTWVSRLRGVRANASKCSHAELDNSETLDTGDPAELGREMAAIRRHLPHITVLGGCCGTDHRHIGEIATQIAGLGNAA